METSKISKTQKIAISGVFMAAYMVLVYTTSGISFGAYQIRIATSLYALGYICPFLTVPLGIANFLSNMLFGGMGLPDMIGGLIVGILTCGSCALMGLKKLNSLFAFFPVLFIPGLGVSTWLSVILNISYPAMALSLCIGQIIPAICGVLLIKLFKHYDILRLGTF